MMGESKYLNLSCFSRYDNCPLFELRQIIHNQSGLDVPGSCYLCAQHDRNSYNFFFIIFPTYFYSST